MTINFASLLTGRALITGGTAGLGATFADALAKRGLDLVLVARDSERLATKQAELSGQYGVDVEVITADLATAEGVARVKERLLDETTPVTVFINNAGAGMYTRMAVADVTKLRAGVELMAMVPMELGGAAAWAMKNRGSGLIISTSSVAALLPNGAYSAVKAFVNVWSQSLANEIGDDGVHVMSFLPGWVRTEFHQRSGVSTKSIPKSLWLDAPRVIDEALRDAERGKTISIPSKRFKFLALLMRHAPRSWVAAVGKKLNKGRR
ncbi:MAG: SDR family NAD(P)-dependent oxidoreductase [Actinomycetaceae bacterium]|nr:SDR family NAD(P)-dependent oxidoreductase [Actinomycetaceae bacterium]